MQRLFFPVLLTLTFLVPAGPSAAAKPKPHSAVQDCPECPAMVTLPGGAFDMGSPDSEPGRYAVEIPQHRVKVGRFAMGRTEITRGQFVAFVEETGHDAGDRCGTFEDGKHEERSERNWRNSGHGQEDNHPAVCLNWNDAQAYVQWLSRKTGKPYRLPTEAEWEYAARAGVGAAHYWGESANQACRYANVMDRTGGIQVPGVTWETHRCTDGYAYTAPVARFRANAFGLHDMLGNIWEWVEDCWHGHYKGAPADGSAWTSGSCEKRVLRGGSWDNDPRNVRAAKRLWGMPDLRIDRYGFRVVREVRSD
ncbi:MAG: formylglycine-generating enzyme family protein [Betaproteobacteria bacterium]|nr:formylglycine-generating enzyme family protein [Betaproteobacteria bacterium]